MHFVWIQAFTGQKQLTVWILRQWEYQFIQHLCALKQNGGEYFCGTLFSVPVYTVQPSSATTSARLILSSLCCSCSCTNWQVQSVVNNKKEPSTTQKCAWFSLFWSTLRLTPRLFPWHWQANCNCLLFFFFTKVACHCHFSISPSLQMWAIIHILSRWMDGWMPGVDLGQNPSPTGGQWNHKPTHCFKITFRQQYLLTLNTFWETMTLETTR